MLYIDKIKKEFWLTIKIALIFGFFFYIVNGNFSVKALFICIAVSALYSFSLSFGQGMLNNYLSIKWDWVKETNKRVYIGIIVPILYTIPTILIVNNGLAAYFLDYFFLWSFFFFTCKRFYVRMEEICNTRNCSTKNSC